MLLIKYKSTHPASKFQYRIRSKTVWPRAVSWGLCPHSPPRLFGRSFKLAPSPLRYARTSYAPFGPSLPFGSGRPPLLGASRRQRRRSARPVRAGTAPPVPLRARSLLPQAPLGPPSFAASSLAVGRVLCRVRVSTARLRSSGPPSLKVSGFSALPSSPRGLCGALRAPFTGFGPWGLRSRARTFSAARIVPDSGLTVNGRVVFSFGKSPPFCH